jgi:hypothetical protein
VAAANVTDIVEYDASTSSIASQWTSSNDRGGRSGGCFGPRRADWLATPTSEHTTQALGHVHNVSTIGSTHRYRAIHSLETVTSDPGMVARCKLNTHADTCVAGPNFQLDEYTGDHCNVTPYSKIPTSREYTNCASINSIHWPQNWWKDHFTF